MYSEIFDQKLIRDYLSKYTIFRHLCLRENKQAVQEIKDKIICNFRHLNRCDMKRSIILTLFIFLWMTMVAQTPQAFKYQAVARDASGNVLANKPVSFKISILSGSVSGIVVYSETHAGKTTNAFGLIDLEIGKGTVVSGTFTSIGWGNNTFYVKVEMDPAGGIAYQTMGTSPLLSVPYALQAKTVESVSTDATLTGNGSSTSPLKIARQSATTGQVLKYNGSAWSPADDKAEGLKLPYKDSTTVPDKATVFRIACIGNTWSSAITGVSKSANGTGVVGEGAFGVVGYATATGGTGVRGVNASTTGPGWGLSGVVNSSDGGGVWGSGGLYGVKADAGSASGYGIYGTASSTSGTTYGVYGRVSSHTGFSGYFKGGKFHVSGRMGIGTETPLAGLHLKGNVFPESFMYLEADAGQDAGFRLYEGSLVKWHIFNSAGAAGLHIYNNAGQTAIFCKQADSNVGIGTTTPGYKLQVGNAGDGTQARGNAWNLLSDARLKKDFTRLIHPLNLIGEINGYYFFWNAGTDKTRQVGFSAQEVQKVIPEIVSKGEDGYLSIEYGKIAPLLVEAIKELKAENERLRAENIQLKTFDEQVIRRLEKLERMTGMSASK